MSVIIVLENCNGCGRCKDVCPFNVFDIVSGYAEAVRSDDCIECCSCVIECPEEAIIIPSCD